MKEITVTGLPQSPTYDRMRRKIAAAEFILDELEMWGRACFEQGHISQGWFDGLQTFLPVERDLLGKRTREHVIERADIDGVFARACRTYALLWDEANGKNKHARAGFNSWEGGAKGGKQGKDGRTKAGERAAACAAIAEIKKRNPYASPTRIQELAAEKLGCSPSTIRNRIRQKDSCK